VLLAVDLT